MLAPRIYRFNLIQTSVISRMLSSSASSTSNKRLSPQPLIKPEKIIPQIKLEEEKVVIDPLKVRDYFGVHKLFTIKDLFESRVHLGHTPGCATPQMRPFIYGSRFNTSIIDLNETTILLRQALNFLAHVAYRGGIIMYIVRQPQLVHMVEKAAVDIGEYAHCRSWSNHTFLASHATFKGEVRLPDVVVFFHTKDGQAYIPHPAIIDCAKMAIATVGIVDTDCDPNLISYPIPGNDDSMISQELYIKLINEAILLGKQKRQEDGLAGNL